MGTWVMGTWVMGTWVMVLGLVLGLWVLGLWYLGYGTWVMAGPYAGRVRRVLKHHSAGLEVRLGMHEYFS